VFYFKLLMPLTQSISIVCTPNLICKNDVSLIVSQGV